MVFFLPLILGVLKAAATKAAGAVATGATKAAAGASKLGSKGLIGQIGGGLSDVGGGIADIAGGVGDLAQGKGFGGISQGAERALGGIAQVQESANSAPLDKAGGFIKSVTGLDMSQADIMEKIPFSEGMKENAMKAIANRQGNDSEYTVAPSLGSSSSIQTISSGPPPAAAGPLGPVAPRQNYGQNNFMAGLAADRFGSSSLPVTYLGRRSNGLDQRIPVSGNPIGTDTVRAVVDVTPGERISVEPTKESRMVEAIGNGLPSHKLASGRNASVLASLNGQQAAMRQVSLAAEQKKDFEGPHTFYGGKSSPVDVGSGSSVGDLFLPPKREATGLEKTLSWIGFLANRFQGPLPSQRIAGIESSNRQTDAFSALGNFRTQLALEDRGMTSAEAMGLEGLRIGSGLPSSGIIGSDSISNVGGYLFRDPGKFGGPISQVGEAIRQTDNNETRRTINLDGGVTAEYVIGPEGGPGHWISATDGSRIARTGEPDEVVPLEAMRDPRSRDQSSAEFNKRSDLKGKAEKLRQAKNQFESFFENAGAKEAFNQALQTGDPVALRGFFRGSNGSRIAQMMQSDFDFVNDRPFADIIGNKNLVSKEDLEVANWWKTVFEAYGQAGSRGAD
jgi:hypothetical protein